MDNADNADQLPVIVADLRYPIKTSPPIAAISHKGMTDLRNQRESTMFNNKRTRYRRRLQAAY